MEGPALDLDRTADDSRIAAEAARPQAVAEHDQVGADGRVDAVAGALALVGRELAVERTHARERECRR
jgi:hypothetical protein